MPPVLIDGARLAGLVPAERAVAVLHEAVLAGAVSDPAPARSRVPVGAGELLLMPAENAEFAGVKVAGVAPGNPDRGQPRITGSYLLCSARTLLPLAVVDGAALTLLRTAAVSALAADLLTAPGLRRLLVFGTGPQALAHLDALRTVRPVERVDVAGRTRAATEAFRHECLARGHPAHLAAADAVERADLVVCATSARTPLFGGDRLAPHATVIAMGSHTPDARELDDSAMRRSTVVVEDVATARREAGDVVLAERSGELALRSLTELVRGEVRPDQGRPRVFKSVGMAWEDLAVAGAAFRAHTGRAVT
ncbi:ornithine cyclodeaminase family protein [Actinophytocola sp.]|uniref:ornithine cyclodeaminase family protein n=1 Tax=Actinophytocola sp. TaxID=1872138 RepID=UPI003D6C250B